MKGKGRVRYLLLLDCVNKQIKKPPKPWETGIGILSILKFRLEDGDTAISVIFVMFFVCSGDIRMGAQIGFRSSFGVKDIRVGK